MEASAPLASPAPGAADRSRAPWLRRIRLRDGLWWLAVLGAWAYAAWFLFFDLPQVPIFSRDTHTYLNHNWHRAIGYPVFLDVILGIFGDIYAVVVVQALLGWAAVTFFAKRLGDLFRLPVFSALLAVLFITQVDLTAYHAWILSESLYISLILFSLGCLMGFVQRPTPRREILLSISVALPIAVRPTAIPLLAGLALVFLFRGRRTIARAVRLFAPWIAIIVGLVAYNFLAIGYPSIFVRRGKAMLANVAHLMPTENRGPYAEVANWLGEKTKDFETERRRTGNFWKFEDAKKRQFEHVAYSLGEMKEFFPRLLAFTKANPDLTNPSVIRLPWKDFYGKHHPGIAIDNVEYQLARIAIGNDLSGYVRQVASNWVSYWYHTHGPMLLRGDVYAKSLNDAKTEAVRVQHGVTATAPDGTARDLEFEARWFPHLFSVFLDTSQDIVHWIRLRTALGAVEAFLLVIGTIASGLAVAGAIWLRRQLLSPRLVTISALLLFIQGHVMMLSLSHHALRRYMNVLEIFIIAAAYLVIRLPLRVWWTRLRRQRRIGRLDSTPQGT